ncbi:MAG: type IV secretion system family protein, partial [Gammaproteobacteria bacterium]|nr:type IV secretion system family protein [Gammaproteobacteria bacterium]
EVQTLEEQVATARNQLGQAQAEFAAITGDRGMQSLLGGTPRNYLPADWAALQGATQGGGSPLAVEVRSALGALSVLAAPRLAALPPGAAAQLQARRDNAALAQGSMRVALRTTSSRFADLQQLIDSLGGAKDQKATLDLQARIGAENSMLQNEGTKLETLYRALQAQQTALSQRERELTVAGHGLFGNRLRPVP